MATTTFAREGACPKCGAPLEVRKQEVTDANGPTGVWSITARTCTKGCRLVADDFAVSQ